MESYCSRGKKEIAQDLYMAQPREAESLKNDVLTVAYHKNDGMYQARMEMPEHTNILKEVLLELLGSPIGVRIGSEAKTQTEEMSLFDGI